MFKKIFLLIFSFLSLFVFAKQVFAQPEQVVTLHLFYGEGCPHCAKEKEFLEEFSIKFPEIEIKQYEVYKNQNNSKLMYETSLLLGAEVGGVPLTVIGDEYLVGFSEGVTDKRIEDLAVIFSSSRKEYKDLVNQAKINLLEDLDSKPIVKKEIEEPDIDKISIPFFGEVDPKTFSLPVLTILLAAVDGFNPCAMWTLLFLISLLVGMEDRKKMWILGGAFIMASAAVYFVFLSAWLNLFLFLGFISWIRGVVAVVALGAGIYYLYDFKNNKEGECKVSDGEKKNKFFNKLKGLINKKNFISALIGIILLAVTVNLIELVCSAGLPAVYTQILSLSDISVTKYYLYLLLYILIFMLDDLIIFIVAMTTLKVTGLQGKYARFSHLIGGILMLTIGLLLLFKPEWLMLG
jgi:glutaredoxin